MAESKTVKFNFKTRSIRDEAGNVIGKSKKQPSVEVAMPMLTAQDLVNYLTNTEKLKEISLIVEAANGILVSQAREQFDEIIEGFGDDTSKEVTASMLDFTKLTLEYIASIPPTQRGAAAISEEEWMAFFEDYAPVMVAATGKPIERIKNHIDLFKKPQKIRSNKDVLKALVEQLDIYMSQSAAIEDTGACAQRMRDKFERWANEPEKTISLDIL